MTNALVKRGVEKEIIEWTEHLLTKRTAIATLGNTTESRAVNNGCPEGGILSPPLFNCVISEAVDLFNADPAANCFGYADDIKLLRIGNNLAEMRHLIQQDINKLMTWACHNNLRFNPDKTKAMIFSRKQKLLGKPEQNRNDSRL